MDEETRLLRLERDLLRLRRSRTLLLRLLEESLDECRFLRSALQQARRAHVER